MNLRDGITWRTRGDDDELVIYHMQAFVPVDEDVSLVNVVRYTFPTIVGAETFDTWAEANPDTELPSTMEFFDGKEWVVFPKFGKIAPAFRIGGFDQLSSDRHPRTQVITDVVVKVLTDAGVISGEGPGPS